MTENKDHTTSTALKFILAQIKNESDSWNRSLSFMMDENIHLKRWLMQLLKSGVDKDMLETAEDYHGYFIKQDQLTSLLRNDIAELDELLLKGNNADLDEIKIKLAKLRDNICNASREFDQLRISFNDHIIAHI